MVNTTVKNCKDCGIEIDNAIHGSLRCYLCYPKYKKGLYQRFKSKNGKNKPYADKKLTYTRRGLDKVSRLRKLMETMKIK